MNARTQLVTALALGMSLTLLGCDDLSNLVLNNGGGTPDTAAPKLEAEDTGTALPIDHPPVDEGTGGTKSTSAEPRRVTLYQLERSLNAVLGTDVNGKPVTWMVSSTQSGFQRYGATLGQADYLLQTEDNLEPSALYAKFVSDAARDACDRALKADAAKSDASTRVIERFVGLTDSVKSNPDGIDQNLRYLKLRFHGVKLADDDTTHIAALRTLFATVVKKAMGSATTPTQAHVKTGWHAVCVALITDPEFHIY